jgi:serine/threonine protein kinase
MSNTKIRKMIVDVTTALIDLHTNNKAHLDIKPSNIVIVSIDVRVDCIVAGTYLKSKSKCIE